MGTPAEHAPDRERRRKQLARQTNAAQYQGRIKLDINVQMTVRISGGQGVQYAPLHRFRKRNALRTFVEIANDILKHVGAPIMDSAITLIADGRLYYRGRDAVELAKSHRFEQVATML